MDTLTVIALLFLVVVYMYLYFNKKTTGFEEDDQTTWPVTFNWDWQGGPGRTAYNIMSENGPYYSGPCLNRSDGPIQRKC